MRSPSELPGAEPFYAYALEGDGSLFTIYVFNRGRRDRLFVSEQDDAVHVVYAASRVRLSPAPSGYHETYLPWEVPDAVDGWLSAPLGDRAIIDATRGQPVKRYSGRPKWDQLRRSAERT